MSFTTKHAHEYLTTHHKPLAERIKQDVKSCDETTQALLMVFRSVAHSTIVWMTNLEDHLDESSVRNAETAMFKYVGVLDMLDAYLTATKTTLPASVRDEQGNIARLHTLVVEPARQMLAERI